jgi:hypothetical protein
MARKLRVEYAGAIYHVMNRGDRREAIVLDHEDRRRFSATLRGWGKLSFDVLWLPLTPIHQRLVNFGKTPLSFFECVKPDFGVGQTWDKASVMVGGGSRINQLHLRSAPCLKVAQRDLRVGIRHLIIGEAVIKPHRCNGFPLVHIIVPQCLAERAIRIVPQTRQQCTAQDV